MKRKDKEMKEEGGVCMCQTSDRVRGNRKGRRGD